MQTSRHELIELEHRFWQALVDEDFEAATGMLAEPAVLVSTHGAVTFGHDDYRRMAAQGPAVVKSFAIDDLSVVQPSDDLAVLHYRVQQVIGARDGTSQDQTQQMADSSVWSRQGGRWVCVLHTETPLGAQPH